MLRLLTTLLVLIALTFGQTFGQLAAAPLADGGPVYTAPVDAAGSGHDQRTLPGSHVTHHCSPSPCWWAFPALAGQRPLLNKNPLAIVPPTDVRSIILERDPPIPRSLI